MKKFSRKDALKLIGLAGVASISGTLINKVYGRDMKKYTTEDDRNSIKNITKLPDKGTWPTKDPFPRNPPLQFFILNPVSIYLSSK